MRADGPGDAEQVFPQVPVEEPTALQFVEEQHTLRAIYDPLIKESLDAKKAAAEVANTVPRQSLTTRSLPRIRQIDAEEPQISPQQQTIIDSIKGLKSPYSSSRTASDTAELILTIDEKAVPPSRVEVLRKAKALARELLDALRSQPMTPGLYANCSVEMRRFCRQCAEEERMALTKEKRSSSIDETFEVTPENILSRLNAGQNPFMLKGGGIFEIARIVQSISPDSVDPAQRRFLLKARQIARSVFEMQADHYREKPIAAIAFHRMQMFCEGLSQLMPRQLLASPGGGGTLVDEAGKLYDHLRPVPSLDGTSVSEQVWMYMDTHGGNSRLIDCWNSGQKGNSWSLASVMVKKLCLEEREVPESAYFWHRDGLRTEAEMQSDDTHELLEGCQRRFLAAQNTSAEEMEDSWYIQQAVTLELLTNAEVPGKTKDGRLVVLRAESFEDVIAPYKLQENQPQSYPIGPLESCSIIDPGFGSNAVAFVVPLHRIGGFYAMGDRDGNSSMLCDNERELVVDFNGLEGTYLGEMIEDYSTMQPNPRYEENRRQYFERAGAETSFLTTL